MLLSCFDPVRRETARLTLEKLVLDGRIHPQRIEEAYERSRAEVRDLRVRAGEDALVELGITEMHPELITLLGQLRYRTSYGQNVLKHLIESAHIAGIMASELRLDRDLVKRCALLHDIGKALTHEVEGSHALIGAEIARRYGEHEDVVHADRGPPQRGRGAYRRSGSHPGRRRDQRQPAGARRESLEAYVKRLERLEEIAQGHEGVEKVFAMQAGREIRVHGAAGQRGRHPGAGDRAGRGQAGGGGADLPGPDPHHGGTGVAGHGVRALARLCGLRVFR